MQNGRSWVKKRNLGQKNATLARKTGLGGELSEVNNVAAPIAIHLSSYPVRLSEQTRVCSEKGEVEDGEQRRADAGGGAGRHAGGRPLL